MVVELVRRNEPELVRRIVQIEAEAFGAGGLNEWILVPLIRHGRVFCLTQKGEILGSVQYMLDWDTPSRAYMVGVSITKAMRGRGLGTELLKESFIALNKDNIVEVELTVDRANTAAIEVYQRKLGFSVLDYRENEYGAGEHRLVMRRLLPD